MMADSPYQFGVKNWKVQASNFFTNVQLGPWRGPIFNSNTFMMETFINEMAEKSGIDAIEWAARGERVVLVRRETNPDDLAGMVASVGILTSRGGKTSHAAVVARFSTNCSEPLVQSNPSVR